MKKVRSIKFNAFLNVVKTVLSIGIHLITIPYASRVLGASHYGKVSYANSIIQYLALLAMLGISNYAQREGPRFRDDHDKINDFASQLFTVNVIATIISYIIMACLLVFSVKLRHYRMLILVQSVIMILTTIGADWINQIYEDYFYMTVRYIIVEIIALGCLFIFVRSPEDYVRYAFIMVMAAAGGNLFNIFYIKRYVHLHFVPLTQCKEHLKPVFKLFFVNLAMVLYISSDITILGHYRDSKTVGVYSLASKIYSTIKNVINAVIMVAIPRLSFYLGHHEQEEYKQLIKKVLDYLLTCLLPVVCGLLILAKPIMLIVGGHEYGGGAMPLSILSMALLFASLACLFSSGVLLLYKRDNVYLMATLISCLVNVGCNFIMIPLWGYNGAAITTLMAEAIMFIMSAYYSFKDHLQLKDLFTHDHVVISSLCGSILILGSGLMIKSMFNNILIQLFLTFCISVVLYIVILALFKNPLLISFMNRFKDKFSKNQG